MAALEVERIVRELVSRNDIKQVITYHCRIFRAVFYT